MRKLIALIIPWIPFLVCAQKPNVLFIAVDDLRPQLGCYGDGMIKTPNIDGLAAEGVVFNRAYCQMAICMASRSSIMSGERPDRNQLYTNGPLLSLNPDALTLNQHFQNNGYKTVGLGKIYHHRSDNDQGWTQEFFWPWPEEGVWEDYGYEAKWYGRGYMDEENKRMARHHDKTQSGRRGMGPAYEAANMPDSLYKDGIIAQQALKELRKLKDEQFFLAVGFIKPHLPFVAPQKYWDMYDENEIKLADNPFVPDGVPNEAVTNWGELRGYYGMPKEGQMPDSLSRKLIHGYNACVSFTDALIGRLLDELDELGLRENTIVVLWGDHGWKLGEHGMWCKHTNFELDARVPLIISAPGMKANGQKTRALTELVDLYPTLCELCNLEQPEHLQGKSMVPLLNTPDLKWKDAVFTQYPSGGHSWGRHKNRPYSVAVMGYSMRTDKYRYTEWIKTKDNTVIARELYNHKNDPDENINVVDKPEHAVLVTSLSEMLHSGKN